jgi:hypothetical protein
MQPLLIEQAVQLNAGAMGRGGSFTNWRHRLRQIKINIIYFICCDDKVKLGKPFLLYPQFMEDLGHAVKHCSVQ